MCNSELYIMTTSSYSNGTRVASDEDTILLYYYVSVIPLRKQWVRRAAERGQKVVFKGGTKQNNLNHSILATSIVVPLSFSSTIVYLNLIKKSDNIYVSNLSLVRDAIFYSSPPTSSHLSFFFSLYDFFR